MQVDSVLSGVVIRLVWGGYALIEVFDSPGSLPLKTVCASALLTSKD